LLDRHIELLDADEVDLRIASGENIALFLSSREKYVEKNELKETEPFFERRNELLNILRDLANDHSRFKNKKERSFQKASFRDILNSIENGIDPDLTLKFKTDTAVFNDWGMDYC
jgi:hypothetical protein